MTSGLWWGAGIMALGVFVVFVWWEHERYVTRCQRARFDAFKRAGYRAARAEYPGALRCSDCRLRIRHGQDYYLIPWSMGAVSCLWCTLARVPA